MHCPRCKQEMAATGGEEFAAYSCASCGGTYYTPDEFRRHLDFASTLPLEQLPLAELLERKAQSVFVVGSPHPVCPVCAAEMAPFNYGYDSNVILGKCPQCGGIWVEPGQVNAIARYVKGHPVLDRFAEGLVEEEREKERLAQTLAQSRPKRFILALPLFSFIPLSAAGELPRRPWMTWSVVGVSVLLFVFARGYVEQMADVPAEIARGRFLYTLVTSQFAHWDLWHLVANMLFLRAFGDRVEDRVGRLRFLGSYLLLGVVAGLAHVLVDVHSDVPCVGASGAISGIMGVYLVLFPVAMVRVVLFYWTVPVPALLYLGVWFIVQTTIPFTSNIAVAAHVGGFLAGMLLGGVFRAFRVGLPPPRRRRVVAP